MMSGNVGIRIFCMSNIIKITTRMVSRQAGCQVWQADCQVMQAVCQVKQAGCQVRHAGCRVRPAGCQVCQTGWLSGKADSLSGKAGCQGRKAGCQGRQAGCQAKQSESYKENGKVEWQAGRQADIRPASDQRERERSRQDMQALGLSGPKRVPPPPIFSR
jgi:hypothetical protein